jgi:hypothetical protein
MLEGLGHHRFGEHRQDGTPRERLGPNSFVRDVVGEQEACRGDHGGRPGQGRPGDAPAR